MKQFKKLFSRYDLRMFFIVLMFFFPVKGGDRVFPILLAPFFELFIPEEKLFALHWTHLLISPLPHEGFETNVMIVNSILYVMIGLWLCLLVTLLVTVCLKKPSEKLMKTVSILFFVVTSLLLLYTATNYLYDIFWIIYRHDVNMVMRNKLYCSLYSWCYMICYIGTVFLTVTRKKKSLR